MKLSLRQRVRLAGRDVEHFELDGLAVIVGGVDEPFAVGRPVGDERYLPNASSSAMPVAGRRSRSTRPSRPSSASRRASRPDTTATSSATSGSSSCACSCRRTVPTDTCGRVRCLVLPACPSARGLSWWPARGTQRQASTDEGGGGLTCGKPALEKGHGVVDFREPFAP